MEPQEVHDRSAGVRCSTSRRTTRTASGTDEPAATGAVSGDGYLVEQVSDVSVTEAITRYEEAFAADIRVPVRRTS